MNVCHWNRNGNWLASGAKDGLIRVYDIRKMKETEVFRGHNCDITTLAWHPQHETLLASGGYNGSMIYWLVNHTQTPHTIIADAHRYVVCISLLVCLLLLSYNYYIQTINRHHGISSCWSLSVNSFP